MDMCIEKLVFDHFVSKSLPRQDESYYAKIIDVLVSNYTSKKISVAMLADLLELNERTLRRKCVELFRQTPTALLTEARILHAEHLLKQNLKVSDIWYRVGFSSHSYFSDVFKQQKKQTPQEYAKRVKNLAEGN